MLVQRVLAVVPDDPQAQVLARRISPPDTPSRQLSREQHAEVEARLANLVLGGQLKRGDVALLEASRGKIVVDVVRGDPKSRSLSA